MSDEELKRRMSKTRRFWDHHGSWVLLIAVGIFCFMAGSGFNAASTAKTVQILMDSHERQDSKRVERIRELLAENRQLTDRLVPQAAQAAKKAEQAAETAKQAVEKASGSN